jgi:hypothetical protein
MSEALERLGVATVGIMASDPGRSRFCFRHRPVHCAVGADPDLVAHRAFGVPRAALTPEIEEAAVTLWTGLVRDAGGAPGSEPPLQAVDRLDGFQRSAGDDEEMQRHAAQATAQLRVDRGGVVRWADVEGARDGLAGLGGFPSEAEVLAAVRAL